VCRKLYLSFTECAPNDLYTECALNDLYTECALNGLYTECAMNDLYLIRERKMSFTLHWAFGKRNDLYSYTQYKSNKNFVR
jgi:hypothetical protein